MTETNATPQTASGRTLPLPDALDAPRAEVVTAHQQRLAYYADTTHAGRPLVLIHSINAAPSSFEVKPLFDHYRHSRPVYSLDLPGFGHSERDAGPYSPERFAQAIADFLVQIVKVPADVIALSLSAEFAARAASVLPAGQMASLVIISPTGFMQRPLPSPRTARFVHKVLSLTALRGLYTLVASRRSIRYYLGRSFVGAPSPALLDYAYATSHQPGARYAPLTFLSTQLFTPDAINQLYGKLTGLPVLAIADRDPYITFERLAEFVASHPNWQAVSLAPHLGLPHWERLPETLAALDAFWI